MHEKSYFDHKSLSKGVEGGDKEQNTYFEVISCFVKRIYLLTYVGFFCPYLGLGFLTRMKTSSPAKNREF